MRKRDSLAGEGRSPSCVEVLDIESVALCTWEDDAAELDAIGPNVRFAAVPEAPSRPVPVVASPVGRERRPAYPRPTFAANDVDRCSKPGFDWAAVLELDESPSSRGADAGLADAEAVVGLLTTSS